MSAIEPTRRDDPFRLPPIPRPPLAIGEHGGSPFSSERSAR